MKSTRDRLLEIHKADPRLNQTEISARIGVSRQRISALVNEMGLNVERGPRGIGSRARAEPAPRPEGIVAPPGASPTVGVLLAAADLARRGYDVYLPVTKDPQCHIVAIDAHDRVERILVETKKRGGTDVRYDTPENDRKMRRALVLTEQPVQYSPALRASAKP